MEIIKKIIYLFLLSLIIVGGLWINEIEKSGCLEAINYSELVNNPVKETIVLIETSKRINDISEELEGNNIKIHKGILDKINKNIESKNNRIKVLNKIGEELKKEPSDYDNLLEELGKMGLDLTKKDLIILKE